MGECDLSDCSGDSSLQNSCSYCGYSYCSTHRLPEQYNCLSLSNANTLGPDFRDVSNTSTAKTTAEHYRDENAGTDERTRCKQCSNYTAAEHDLCLRCRRKEQTMSSKSPDVQIDGSLEKSSEADTNNSPRENEGGLLSKLKSIFRRE